MPALSHDEIRTADRLAPPKGLALQSSLTVGFGLVTAALAALAALAYTGLSRVAESERQMFEHNFSVVQDVWRLRSNLNAERLDVVVMAELSPSAWVPWERDLNERIAEDREILARLEVRLRHDRPAQDLFRELAAVTAAFRRTAEEEVLPRLRAGKSSEAKEFMSGIQMDWHMRLRAIAQKLQEGETEEAARMADAARRLAHAYLVTLGLAGSASIIGAVALGVFLRRSVTQYVVGRQQAEMALQRAAAYDRSLIEASLDPLVTIGPDGRIADVNTATETVTGIPRAQLIGTDFSDYFTEPDKARAGYRLVFREGAVHDYPLELRHRDGRVTSVLYNASVYRDETGAVAGVFAAARDITERKRAEAVLRESEDKFRHVFDHSLIGKSITLPDGEIQVNDAFCRMLGYTREELMRRHWREITHPDDVAESQNIVDAILAGRRDAARFTKRYVHKNGTVVWADVGTVVRRDATGRVLYLMTSASDITENRRAEEAIHRLNAELEQRVHERTAELETVNRELEAFAYSVSHDLRAPLRGIDGFGRILLSDHAAALDEAGRENLQRIRAATRRMGTLIDDLLQLSRTARCELVREPLNLGELARTIAAEFAANEPARRVEWRIAPELAAVADSALMRIVLVNLLGNAWKFTGRLPAAEIEFSTVEQGGEPVFRVRDNGTGFDMRYAGKLFGAFQRLHSSDEFPGTGIGLATVQRIIHRHGGRVWAESAPGAGASFYFTLTQGGHKP